MTRKETIQAGKPAPTMVALEVVLLWPRGLTEPATIDEASQWPVFVVVVGDRPETGPTMATPLFDLLDRPRCGGELLVVTGEARWSVVDPRNALLTFGVHATSPVRFSVQILIPAQCVLRLLKTVARGATVGITTRRGARRLTDRVSIPEALGETVLFNCHPSGELTVLAERICAEA